MASCCMVNLQHFTLPTIHSSPSSQVATTRTTSKASGLSASRSTIPGSSSASVQPSTWVKKSLTSPLLQDVPRAQGHQMGEAEEDRIRAQPATKRLHYGTLAREEPGYHVRRRERRRQGRRGAGECILQRHASATGTPRRHEFV